jgi:hypothetical protein
VKEKEVENSSNDNRKYCELLWHGKYDKIELGQKAPVERLNLPFQVVETVDKPRVRGGTSAFAFSRRGVAAELSEGLEEYLGLG